MGAAIVLTLLVAAQAAAADRWVGLERLERVALAIVVEPAHPQLAPDDLRRHVGEAVQRSARGLRIDAEAPDTLRLTVNVQRVSANELRGFYLPFSGDYGFGAVRLTVEREATVPRVAAPVPAVVWQADRLARAGWGQSGREVLTHLTDLIRALAEDYRRAGNR